MSETTSRPPIPTAEAAERLSVQCCIAGGGPAGMMAGFLLARAGVRVLVLEKHADFLRDFRGDTVHPSTMQALYEVGLLERFLERPHTEIRRVEGQVGPDTIRLADLSHLPTAARFVALMPQWEFLDFLSGEAKRFPEFALRMSTEAVELVEEAGTVTGLVARSTAGRIEIQTDLVIVADGRDSRFRAQAGLAVDDFGAPIDVLWTRLPRRPDDPQAVLGRIGPGYALVLIDRGDYYQSAFVVAKGGYEAIRAEGLNAFRARIARADARLTDRTEAIKGWDDVKLLHVTVDRLRRWWKPGLVIIGDAAHAMSPVGGVGINLAIQDAVAAANILAGPLKAGRPSPETLARVQRRRFGPVRAMQSVQVAAHRFVLARALSSTTPFRAPWPARLFNWLPVLRRIPGHVIGMGFRMEHVRSPDVH